MCFWTNIGVGQGIAVLPYKITAEPNCSGQKAFDGFMSFSYLFFVFAAGLRSTHSPILRIWHPADPWPCINARLRNVIWFLTAKFVPRRLILSRCCNYSQRYMHRRQRRPQRTVKPQRKDREQQQTLRLWPGQQQQIPPPTLHQDWRETRVVEWRPRRRRRRN